MKCLQSFVLLLCALVAPRLVWSDDAGVSRQLSEPAVLLVDAGKPGPVFDIDFVGNASRLNAFLGVLRVSVVVAGSAAVMVDVREENLIGVLK